MTAETRSEATVPLLAAAILANGAAGLLYVWSLFILPIEAALTLNRADLGLISSLSLISFTAGVSIQPAILAWIGRMGVAALAFLLIAGGHIAFGISSSWGALALGYGLGFGAGSGMAYGLALSLAASLSSNIRSVAIGLAMGAFALSGIVLPVALGNWIATIAPDTAFLRIGIAVVAVGALCVLLLAGRGAGVKDQVEAAAKPIKNDRPFFVLSLIFFLICFVGLATISQAAAMAAAAGIGLIGFAATALTLGYLAGSLLGAPLAERVGERIILLSLGLFLLAGSLAMLSGIQPMFLLGAALIGVTFGGSGSIMPVLLGMRYGAENISRLYGRMIIAYGLAGLVAPGLAGLLYESQRSYTPQLVLCAAMAILILCAVLILESKATPDE